MAKTFKSWDVDQLVLLPPSVHELVPAGHLAHFARDMVRDFRQRHLRALGERFTQVLTRWQKAGLVTLGHVALDGTTLKANASKHTAMRYGRMQKAAVVLTAMVQGWLEKAATLDAHEDAEWGPDRRGDDLPAWVTDKQQRREKIRHAKAAVEAETRADATATRPASPGAGLNAILPIPTAGS